MTKPQSIPVLRGTYTAPALRRGDRTDCLVRDCMMVVTTWSDAPISWPRGRPALSSGGASLIVDEELARAVRHESAAAIHYWWRVNTFTICRWRKVLGVTRRNNEGSQILIRIATEKAKRSQNPNRSAEYRQNLREHINRRRLWELSPEVTCGIAWTSEHKALLGTMIDREVASRTGHSYCSVKTMRLKLRIPCYRSKAAPT
jgi:hypothetical protein